MADWQTSSSLSANASPSVEAETVLNTANYSHKEVIELFQITMVPPAHCVRTGKRERAD